MLRGLWPYELPLIYGPKNLSGPCHRHRGWVADDTYLAATGEHLILYEVNGSEDPTKRCHVGPSVYCASI